MTAQEARLQTQKAKVKLISTQEGNVIYSNLVEKVNTAAQSGDNIVRTTLMSRHAKEIEARFKIDGFLCRHWPLDEQVSLIYIEW